MCVLPGKYQAFTRCFDYKTDHTIIRSSILITAVANHEHSESYISRAACNICQPYEIKSVTNAISIVNGDESVFSKHSIPAEIEFKLHPAITVVLHLVFNYTNTFYATRHCLS